VYLAPGTYFLNETLAMGSASGTADDSGGVLWTTDVVGEAKKETERERGREGERKRLTEKKERSSEKSHHTPLTVKRKIAPHTLILIQRAPQARPALPSCWAGKR
jgi:hypothetical protein